MAIQQICITNFFYRNNCRLKKTNTDGPQMQQSILSTVTVTAQSDSNVTLRDGTENPRFEDHDDDENVKLDT